MNEEHGLEAWGEAFARVIGKLVSFVFRVIWAIIGGFLAGLCLLPFLRGFKKAIVYELNHPPKQEE